MDDPEWLMAQAEEAARKAARCYDVVAYAEHLEAARVWRARAVAAAKARRNDGDGSNETP